MKKKEEARAKKPPMAGVGKSQAPMWLRCPDCGQLQSASFDPIIGGWKFAPHNYDIPGNGNGNMIGERCVKKPENVVDLPKRRTA